MNRKELKNNDEKLLIGFDNRMVFLVDYPTKEEGEESPVTEAELIYRAVRNTVNNIWEKYSNEETDSGLLNPNEIKSFLKDFLKDHQISETDLDFIVSNMNTDKNGRIDKYEMTAFVLTLTGYEKLIKPR